MARFFSDYDESAEPEGDDLPEEIGTDRNLDRILREIGEGKRLTGTKRG